MLQEFFLQRPFTVQEDDKEDEILAREKDYEILDQKQLEKKQQEEIENLKETLGISLEKVRVILRTFNWNTEKIMNLFLEHDREYVLKKAGLTDDDDENSCDKQENDEPFLCPLCYDDVPFSQSTMLAGCKHRFCNTCWKVCSSFLCLTNCHHQTYIELKIKEGLSKRIFCMGFKCEQALDESIVSKYFFSPKKKFNI